MAEIIERIDSLRSEINDLKATYADDRFKSEWIQEALDDLLHAQIVIDNVLM